MLEVEGKTFHKFVEKKEYRTYAYDNSCPIKDNENRFDFNQSDYMQDKTGQRFYNSTTLFTEDDFSKHYGNTLSTVNLYRWRFFIEESDNKISLKYQYYTKNRNVGKRYFYERKITYYFTFNFTSKMFYSGTFHTKRKKVLGSTMKVNPTYYALEKFMHTCKFDDTINPESYLYFFLEKIWDKMGIENPQNFETKNVKSFYSLTYYLINGIKLPNYWLKFTGIFFPKKDLKKFDMNLVETAMERLKLKGSKVKKILNEIEWVNFDRLYGVYKLLGIDRFNKISNNYFSSHYSTDDYCYKLGDQVIPMGQSFDSFYDKNNQYLQQRLNVTLNAKEKDRILNIITHFDNNKWSILLEHLNFKKTLLELGEDVRLKFNTVEEFNLEHEEFSRIIQSYKTGEVERFYGDVDELENQITYQDEIYYPVLLRKTMDYEKESQHQRNCVRGYSERADCIIFSIRKGSKDGDQRITVEYQYRNDKILNVQERERFNQMPSFEFSQVAKIQLANINLMYKLGTLKLPKMVKTYRNGRTIEQESTFKSLENDGTKIISMSPCWNTSTPELQNWQNQILELHDLPMPNNFINDIDNLF